MSRLVLGNLYTQTLVPNVAAHFTGGSYFRIMASVAAVDVRFFKDGSEVGKAEGVLSGFWAEADDGANFDKVTVTSATAQDVTISVATGRMGYDRITGNVTVQKATGASDAAHVALAAGATDTIALDATRRALILGSLAANAGNLLTGPLAAAGRGRELQPGTEHIWNTTAAIKIHNPAAVVLTYTIATEND